MKKTKVIIPALGILLLSTAASVTGTVAWFSMNTHVTANDIHVQAKAEDGIVITNEAGTAWAATAGASHNALANLVPTSTQDLANWYHNSSTEQDNAMSHQAATTYEHLNDVAGWKNANGVQFVDSDSDGVIDDNEKAYFLLNKFYIKSSAAAIEDATFKINSVTATGVNNSALLDASLRVGIKINTQVFIYAPVSGATITYYVAGADSAYTATSSAGGAVNTAVSSVTTIPSNAATLGGGEGVEAAIEAQVFVYFEGEDPECKSSNIAATLDQLAVTVQFGTQNA